jgi:hypothetical protein
MTPPSLEEFLAGAVEDIAPLVPRTLVLNAGGTRREALLNGVAVDAPHTYAEFSLARFADLAETIFGLGVEHLFAVTIISKRLDEAGGHRDHLTKATVEWVGHRSLPHYRRLGCRVRLVGHEDVPGLAPLARLLEVETSTARSPTIWWLTSPSPHAVWRRTHAALRNASSVAEAVRVYFGEDVPPAGIYLCFGKFLISPEFLPPLLMTDETHCYFYQAPGYGVTERQLREVIYDYAYTRRTGDQDKAARYPGVVDQREVWETGPVLGVGRRVGGFWFPHLP